MIAIPFVIQSIWKEEPLWGELFNGVIDILRNGSISIVVVHVLADTHKIHKKK